jgi:hypothetical protein
VLQKNRDYCGGYGMKPIIAYVCKDTVFWAKRDSGRLIKIVVETNPSKNGWQDYLIYYGYGPDEIPAEAMAQSHQMYIWFTERWLGLYGDIKDEA